MNPRRELRLAVLLCLLGAGLVLLAVGRTWVTFRFPSALTTADLQRAVRGATIVPGARALGYVGLAGVLALAATRRWGRSVVGVVLAAAGVGTVVVVGRALSTGLSVRALGNEDLSHACPGSSDAQCLKAAAAFAGIAVHEHPVWAWVAITGGVALAGAGALLAVRGRRWAALSSSYEVAGEALPPVTDKGVWDALDRGDDPTA